LTFSIILITLVCFAVCAVLPAAWTRYGRMSRMPDYAWTGLVVLLLLGYLTYALLKPERL